MSKQILENTNLLKLLTKENEKLKLENKNKDETIIKMQIQINDIEQMGRNRNLQILGVREVQGENCINIIKKIGEECQLEIKTDQIESAYRVPTMRTDTPKSIIVQFSSLRAKEGLLQKKKLVTTNTNINGTPVGTNIYINEHISPHFKNLLSRTKRLSRDAGYKYVWYKNRAVFVRKSENSEIFKLLTECDMLKLLGTH